MLDQVLNNMAYVIVCLLMLLPFLFGFVLLIGTVFSFVWATSGEGIWYYFYALILAILTLAMFSWSWVLTLQYPRL